MWRALGWSDLDVAEILFIQKYSVPPRPLPLRIDCSILSVFLLQACIYEERPKKYNYEQHICD